MSDKQKRLWSIIIPTRNEAVEIDALLKHLQRIIPNAEIIVVDAGSSDATESMVGRYPGIQWIAMPGQPRGVLWNTGAQASKGNYLLFLHADTFPQAIEPRILERELCSAAAACFRFRLDSNLWSARLIEWGVGLRNRFFHLAYGDQGLIVDRRIFNKIGGYANLPLLEDVEILQRLSKEGQIKILPVPAFTSARRYTDLGIIRTTLLNYGIILAYYLGFSPWKLAKLYWRHR